MRVFRNFPFSQADDVSDDVGVGDAGDNVPDEQVKQIQLFTCILAP